MFRLFISEDARLDILHAIFWYEDIRPGLGLEFKLLFEKSIQVLSDSPAAFEKRYQHIRVYFMDRFPYGIHYYFEKNSIFIIAVFHTNRKPENWHSRL